MQDDIKVFKDSSDDGENVLIQDVSSEDEIQTLYQEIENCLINDRIIPIPENDIVFTVNDAIDIIAYKYVIEVRVSHKEVENNYDPVVFSYDDIFRTPTGKATIACRRELASMIKIISEEYTTSQISKFLDYLLKELNGIEDIKDNYTKSMELFTELKGISSGNHGNNNYQYAWKEYVLPNGYAIKDNSNGGKTLYQIEGIDGFLFFTPICDFCILVGMGKSKDGGDQYGLIKWLSNDGEEYQDIFITRQILSKKGIIETLSAKVNITENKSGMLQEYFRKTMESVHLHNFIVTDRNGWHEEAFQVGDRTFSPKGNITIVNIEKTISPKLSKAGTLEGWIDGIKDIICDPVLRAHCYAAMAAPLLKPLGIATFVINSNFDTSKGKSLKDKGAIGLYGNPAELIIPADSTAASNPQLLYILNNHLVCFDESTLAGESDHFGKLIYRFAQGHDRFKMKQQDGGHIINKPVEWSNIISINGENPILDDNANSGQKVRVLEVRKMMKVNVEGVKHFEDTVIPTQIRSGNYGHIIELYLQKVFSMLDGLQAEYEKCLALYQNKDSMMKNRMGASLAVLTLAGVILEEVFKDIGIPAMNPIDVVKEVYGEYVEKLDDCPTWHKALNDIFQYAQAEKMYFNDAEPQGITDYNPHGNISNKRMPGHWDNTYICLFSKQMKDALGVSDPKNKKPHGYYTKMMEDFKANGILVIQGKRSGYTSTNRINDKLVTGITLDIKKIKEAIGMDFAFDAAAKDAETHTKTTSTNTIAGFDTSKSGALKKYSVTNAGGLYIQNGGAGFNGVIGKTAVSPLSKSPAQKESASSINEKLQFYD
ncbi:DUF927 domain-containing protein [Methanolobus sp.]|uniref:DUF927 domain-containing protein n=1 Tax=Methanolobus sp. TaxID=1874737 RepID=UPI0025E8E0E9|nr:DUF927 domain-containing protein [Methanolobus sp.]